MYTYFYFKAETVRNNKEEKITASYSSQYNAISKFIELCEAICNSIKNAEKATSFTFYLYAIDDTKAQKELENDSYTNYHGDLWKCYEGNKEEGYYFAPYHNNFNKCPDFVITAKNPLAMLKEINTIFGNIYKVKNNSN